MSSPLRTLLPIKFSLAGLMLSLTAGCVLCGLAVNDPLRAIQCAMLALPFVPTAILWLVILGSSRRPTTILTMSFIGTCVCLMLFQSINFATAKPAIVRIPGHAQLYFDVINTGRCTIGAAFGTLLFGGILLIEEFRSRRLAMKAASTAAQNPPPRRDSIL